VIKVTFEPEVRFNSQKYPFSMSPSDILSLFCLGPGCNEQSSAKLEQSYPISVSLFG